MKKLIGFITGIFIILGIGFFTYEGEENKVGGGADSGETVNVGLLQLASHPALDDIAQGTVDALEDEGFVEGENMNLDYQNAQGDQANLSTMSSRFAGNDSDVMIGIATPAAQALANESPDIPIVMGAVTDPVNVGLVEDLENPGGNITGVSDMTPVREQIELILDILPDAERIGVFHSASEENSVLQGEMAIEAINDMGLEAVNMTVTSTNDVSQVGAQLVNEVDAIWVPNDNIIASAFPTLVESADNAGVPIFPAVDTMVAQGGLATLGLNQYNLGYVTGQMAAAVLNGEDPGAMPIQYPDEVDLVINQEKADQLGINIPDNISTEATEINETDAAEGEE